MQQEEPIYVRTHNNRVSKNEEISLNNVNNGGSRNNGSSINGEVRFNNMYGDHSLSRPPPPMYRRVPPPAHMMTLDRRIPGGAGQGVRGLQHQLLPSGCDVTLNRRHFNNADLRNTNHCSPMQRRLPDDLWLVWIRFSVGVALIAQVPRPLSYCHVQTLKSLTINAKKTSRWFVVGVNHVI